MCWLFMSFPVVDQEKMSLKIIKKIWKVFQPKDYIRFKMTGEIATEVTDASASGIYDVKIGDGQKS